MEEVKTMNAKRSRWSLGLALGLVLSFLGTRAAQAFTYNTGDLVTVFVNGGHELIADLGPLSSLPTTPIVLQTQAVLGSNGGLGGIFTAFQTVAPFSGNNRTLVFTADPTLSPAPPAFDNNAISTTPAYTAGLEAGQSALDAGSPASGGWLQQLSGIPSGATGVSFVGATTLGLNATTFGSSYSNLIGLGTNQVNNQLPFSTAANLSANGQVVDLWSGQVTRLNHSTTTLLGTLSVDGNVTGSSGNEVEITFSPVPEPGTMLLLSMGVVGLTWRGRRRRSD
jgi:PEP-CTERM motif